MKKMKIYEADDQMVSLIRDNYSILQALGAFGINLGFGDKLVQEVCEQQNVDTHTFLTVVNFIINGYYPKGEEEKLSVTTLLQYLKASHLYYLDFQLPFIRRELEEALDPEDQMTQFIMRIYDEYARSIRQHMKYEEKTVFPYVEALLKGKKMPDYDVEMFSKHHSDTTGLLLELKNVIIKYLPGDGLSNNKLTATLYDIYNNEEWLQLHSNVEDEIFIPAIRKLESTIVSTSDSNVISSNNNTKPTGKMMNTNVLSDREKEVIACLAKGMINKEIADHLFISVNTVLTHRRNIARKLQIHSPAGLTVFAIVNGLVDISNIKNL